MEQSTLEKIIMSQLVKKYPSQRSLSYSEELGTDIYLGPTEVTPLRHTIFL
jgi:hypothetical protein